MKKIECLGMYFNEMSIDEDEMPAQDITINKDVLDRSSGNIIGCFKFDIDNRSKLVFSVELDDRIVDNFGTNLPYQEHSGIYDTVLFHYPNSARANKAGMHRVHVEFGLIDGIVESKEGLINWGPVEAKGSVDFVIRLTPGADPSPYE